MKRWNGWGDVGTEYPLSDSARQFLGDTFGAREAAPDASLEAVMNSVPASRLIPHPLVTADRRERLF